MTSALGSASAVTFFISPAGASAQPRSFAARVAISRVTAKLASVCSSRSFGCERPRFVPTATLIDGDCDCAIIRAVAE